MDKFFIVGCPRSGTTMVQQALNRHSQVAIPPETKYFFSFVGHSHSAQRRHVQRLNDDLGIALRPPVEPVRDDGDARRFYDAMANQYVGRFPRKRVAMFGEKTPEHTGHLDRIRRVFPKAKLIVVYRDGRDVALSLAKTPWMPGGVYVGFLVWLYYQRLVARLRRENWSDAHFVRYEDAVADPERVFRGALDFLGLPYEAAVAHGHGNREGVPPREDAWKARALEPITAERVGTFRRELNPSQLATLERLGKRTLSEFDYELETDGRGPLSAGLLPLLAFGGAAFARRLPLYTLARELGERALAECAGVAAACRRFARRMLRVPLPWRLARRAPVLEG
jgi:hypothetical protein